MQPRSPLSSCLNHSLWWGNRALCCAGHLYADDTPVEQMRQERGDGIESARRGRSVEENLRIWGEMFAATDEGEVREFQFHLL